MTVSAGAAVRGLAAPGARRDRPGMARAALLAWLLGFALLTRISVFGDAGYTNDEAFYFLVGQRMHDGLLPYVDIWDRKGPGLFLVYYLIAGISWSVIAYQIAAMLAAAATAWCAAAIAERLAGRPAAVFAGTVWLYRLVGTPPPSRLLFPMHLFHPYENNAGPFDTGAEMRRILAWKPSVVIRYADTPPSQENPATTGQLRAYTARCRLWFRQRINQVAAVDDVLVYGDCRG